MRDGRRKILYVVVQAFCEACSEAKGPALEFMRAHLADYIVIFRNLNLRTFQVGKFKPKYTPSYAFVDEAGNLEKAIEGEVLTLKDLEQHAGVGSGAQ